VKACEAGTVERIGSAPRSPTLQMQIHHLPERFSPVVVAAARNLKVAVENVVAVIPLGKARLRAALEQATTRAGADGALVVGVRSRSPHVEGPGTTRIVVVCRVG